MSPEPTGLNAAELFVDIGSKQRDEIVQKVAFAGFISIYYAYIQTMGYNVHKFSPPFSVG